MRKIGTAVLMVALCLSLSGAAFAGESQDKYKELEKLESKDEKIEMKWKQQDLRRVFGAIEKIANVNVSFGAGFPDGTKVTTSWDKGTFKDALIDLAEKYHLTYEVPDAESLVVKGVEAPK